MDQLLAAVDLGSNSFRLSIGRIVQQDGTPQIYQIDRLKETVRLAAGLDAENAWATTPSSAPSPSSNVSAIACAVSIPTACAVATNTFRVARNTRDFLPRAEAALGFPIEVIAGREEARLIFSGVVHTLPLRPTSAW